jgi:phospholipid/cholesterol/gamma-HCH transport system substrate-binding protein
MTAIRKNLKNFIAVLGLMVIAAGVGGYILSNQRLRFPWEGQVFKLKAEFSTAQAVTPGQGQTVRCRACASATSPRSSCRTGARS